MKNVIYSEEQKGRNMGLFFLLSVILILAISRMVNDLVTSKELTESFPLWAYGLVITSLVAGIIYFWKVKLTIKVGEKSIKAKYFPNSFETGAFSPNVPLDAPAPSIITFDIIRIWFS